MVLQVEEADDLSLAKTVSNRPSIVECHTVHTYEVRTHESKEWSFNLKDSVESIKD